MEFQLPNYSPEQHSARPFEARGGSYDLQKLKERHHAIVRLVLANKTDVEIAEVLNVTPQMVAYTRKSTLVQEKIDAMRSILDAGALQVQSRIQEASPLALQELLDMLTREDTNASLRTKIAQDLLDRAGHSAVKNVNVRMQHISQDDIEDIKSRARMNGTPVIEDGEVVQDAHVIEEDP